MYMNKQLTRRDFLKTVGVGSAALSLTTRSTANESKQDTSNHRWNILWISCEDTSPDLGCYGDEYADTPNLDRFAQQGCRYTHAFVPYPVCAPTRSAVITGMYPSTIGTMHMRTGMKGYEAVPPAQVKCFTEYLRAAGYYCTNNSKTDYQFKCPFTAWDDNGKQAHWRNRPAGKPFFSVINLGVSHESRNWPKKNEKLIHEPNNVSVPPYYPDTPVVRENLARYYDNVTKMDQQVGKILQQLEQDGLAENTVVFFWSDHGRGLPRCKRWLYDSGIQVPLLVRWPGNNKAGTICDDFVSLVDLGPTTLSVAGIPIPAYIQGKAFLGKQKVRSRECIIAGRERMDLNSDDHIRCVRDKQYKYIRNFMPDTPYAQPIPYRDKMPIMQEWRRLHARGLLKDPQKRFMQDTKPPEELYDITSDPHEIRNLAELTKYKNVLQRMRERLNQWIKKTGDLGGTPEEDLIERMWPGRKQPVTAAPRIHISKLNRNSVRVTITCETEGASLGYRLDGTKKPWHLYSQPLEAKIGTRVIAKAIRIGYKPSKEVSVTIDF